jgi:hypothetical protein
MHFLMTDEYLRARQVELFRAARPKRPKQAGRFRQRVGWLLVDAGLRLAVRPPAALREVA